MSVVVATATIEQLFVVEARCVSCMRQFEGRVKDVIDQYRDHECKVEE